VLLHFGHDPDARLGVLDDDRVVQLGQVLGLEFDVEHRADDLGDTAGVAG
jgi:hypothetical protein